MRLSARPVAWSAAALGAAALFVHAQAFDFVCDDAFITFRYAKNLASFGEAVYNPGERVEGYTNFLWMVLAAGLFKAGASLATAVLVLRLLTSVLVASAIVTLSFRLRALGRWMLVVPVVLASGTVAIAAWTASGLETAFYAAWITFGLAFGADVAADASPRSGAKLGACLALAALTRPEGLAVLGIYVFVLAILRRREVRRPLLVAVGVAAAVLVPFFLWRLAYYGHPLPNTFYAKTSGDAAAHLRRGRRYIWFAARSYGPFAALLFFPLFVPPKQTAGEDEAALRARTFVVLSTQALVVFTMTHACLVGGDFLPLHRFFVPVLPAMLVASVAGLAQLVAYVPPLAVRPRLVAAAGLVLAGAFLVVQQVERGGLAEGGPEGPGIEPLRWTQRQALRWAAIGRWIAARARPGDSMAIGAAGAMPYHAGLPNVDLHGLCDAWVARYGEVVSNRPGHQRYAPRKYILERRPTFLFDEDFDSDQRSLLPRNKDWERDGYVWIEAHVTPERDGAPSPFYAYFLLRKDRAKELAGDPDVLMPEDVIPGGA